VIPKNLIIKPQKVTAIAKEEPVKLMLKLPIKKIEENKD